MDMDYFRIENKMDFPIYRKEVKDWFNLLLKIRKIPFTWHNVEGMAYIGFYRIQFFSSSEMFDFFFAMGSLFGIKEEKISI